MHEFVVVAPIVGFIGLCLVFAAVRDRVLGPPVADSPDKAPNPTPLNGF